MGCKASETTRNINNTFDPKTANEHTVQWCFKKFCKEETPEDEEHSGWPSEVDNNLLRGSSKLILSQPHENSTSTMLQSFSIWSTLERWKSLISGCLMNWPPIKKIIILKCRLLLLYTTTNHFSIRLWCAIKNLILYDNQQHPPQWLDQEEAPKHFPKPNLHQKKVMITVSWSAACLIHYSFLNRGETITFERCAQWINEMHWQLQYLQPALVKRRAPILQGNTQLHIIQSTLQKLNELGDQVLPHLPSSPDLLPRLPLLQVSWQLCAGKMLPQPAGGRKCFPRVHWIPKHGFLCYRNKQTYFSLATMCWF